MRDQLEKIETVRRLALRLLAVGARKGYPLATSVKAVRGMFLSEGVPMPGDVLAFVSGGKVNAAMVRDWSDPYGGN